MFELAENRFRKSFSVKPTCLAVTENDIFQKMTSSWSIFSPLTRKWFSTFIFTSNHFQRERERESPNRAAPTSYAIDEIALCDCRSTCDAIGIIDRAACRTLVRRAFCFFCRIWCIFCKNVWMNQTLKLIFRKMNFVTAKHMKTFSFFRK